MNAAHNAYARTSRPVVMTPYASPNAAAATIASGRLEVRRRIIAATIPVAVTVAAMDTARYTSSVDPNNQDATRSSR